MIAPDSFILQLTVHQLKEIVNDVVEARLRPIADLLRKPAPDHQEILSMKTLPAYVHMSKSKLYKLVSAGKIPHYHCGQKLLFKKADIDAWLEEQRIA